MKQAVTRELYAYWNDLRGGRAAPERADIDPAAIRSILSDTFILEFDQENRSPLFPFRLSGTRLNALFLTELKGRSILDLWEAGDRAALVRILHGVPDDSAPVVAGLRAAPHGHPPIELELLLLPLRHHGRTHSRILGAITPMRVPSWLGLLPIEHLSLASLRHVDQSQLAMLASRPDPSFIGGRVQATTPRRYGNLVVHQGGR
jgi:hypothetical protein